MASYAYQEVLMKPSSKSWNIVLLKLLFEFSITGYFVNRYNFAILAINKQIFNSLTDNSTRSRHFSNTLFYVNRLKYNLVTEKSNCDSSENNTSKRYKYYGYTLKSKIKPVKVSNSNTMDHQLTICSEIISEIHLSRFLILNPDNECRMISKSFYFHHKGVEKCLDLSFDDKFYRATVEINNKKRFIYQIESSVIYNMIIDVNL